MLVTLELLFNVFPLFLYLFTITTYSCQSHFQISYFMIYFDTTAFLPGVLASITKQQNNSFEELHSFHARAHPIHRSTSK